jgi:cell division protein FtsB
MKDWNDIPDEEFDDAFRDISLNHKEDVWPEAWSLMEEKLEEENRKRRFLIFWRSAAAILIFGTLGIISIGYFKKENLENKIAKVEKQNSKTSEEIENKKNIADIQNKAQKQVIKASDLNKKQNTLEIVAKTPTNISKTSGILSEKISQIIQRQEVVKRKTKADKENHNDKKVINQQQLISKKSVTENAVIQKTEIQLSTEKTDLAITEKKPESMVNVEAKEMVSVNKETKLEEIYFSEDTVIILTTKSEPLVSQAEINDISGAKPTEKPRILERLAFNLGFSPDYSKVNTSTFGQMGHNYQLILDFKISPKLTFRTGIIQSLKLYDAYPKDYVWPLKWGKPSSPLKEVTATCKMLDIPVSLSYQLLEKGPNKLYTSLGVTNYKMMNEKYEYWYENDADPNLKWRKWEGSTGFFGAGIVNVSFGLERKITNFLSVQLEPFVKIPIRNVGFGNVKLLTTGLFLNIKTQAPRKKMQPK